MVSGFLTSPCDHSRIFSGDASEMRIAEKDSGSFGFSKKLKMSFIAFLVGDRTESKTENQNQKRLYSLLTRARSLGAAGAGGGAGGGGGGAAETAPALAFAATSR